jgi:putative peptidoglycan lipid II flippase
VALARCLGLASAVAFTVYAARQFGTTRSTDIAFNAVAIPNAMLAVLALFLPPIFVSVFKSVELERGREEAWGFARSAVRVSWVAGVAASAAGALLSPLLARAIGAEFAPEEVRRMSGYLACSFLLLLVVAVSSTVKGILSANDSYVVPALDTFTTNATGIAVIALTSARWGPFSIVAATVAGGASKIVLMLPGYLRRRPAGRTHFLHPALKEVPGLLGPILLRCLLLAINVGVVRALASRIPVEGAVTHLNYAERIWAAPHDLFAVSLSVVLLPLLAKHAAAGEAEDLKRRMHSALRLVTFFGFPAAVGLTVLAEPIVRFLCERGQFDPRATAETARALQGYAPALIFSGQFVLHQAFYAWKQTRFIFISAAAMLITNVLVGIVLVGTLRQFGLALAFTASCAAGFAVSLALFSARAGWAGASGLLSGAVRSAICAAGMGVMLLELPRRVPLHVTVWIGLGAVTYAILARLLCPVEWAHARKLWSRW